MFEVQRGGGGVVDDCLCVTSIDHINDFTKPARDCRSFAMEIGTAFSKDTILPA